MLIWGFGVYYVASDEKLLPPQRNAATASKKTTSKKLTSNSDYIPRQETNKENLQEVEVQDFTNTPVYNLRMANATGSRPG